MIVWTNNGPLSTSEGNKETLQTIQDAINDAIMNHDAKITIRQLYRNYLGVDLNCAVYKIEPDLYVDPDDWGWDRKGFRQLYRTRIIREEL